MLLQHIGLSRYNGISTTRYSSSHNARGNTMSKTHRNYTRTHRGIYIHTHTEAHSWEPTALQRERASSHRRFGVSTPLPSCVLGDAYDGTSWRQLDGELGEMLDVCVSTYREAEHLARRIAHRIQSVAIRETGESTHVGVYYLDGIRCEVQLITALPRWRRGRPAAQA